MHLRFCPAFFQFPLLERCPEPRADKGLQGKCPETVVDRAFAGRVSGNALFTRASEHPTWRCPKYAGWRAGVRKNLKTRIERIDCLTVGAGSTRETSFDAVALSGSAPR